MKNHLALFLLCLLANVISAQKVSVSSIEETRSTTDSYFGNRCKVKLKLTGDEVRKFKYVKINTLAKAVDDQGLELINEEESDFDYQKIEETTAEVELTLHPSSRKAEVIKELKGDILLFNPTEATGSLIKVANFQSKPNTNLLPAKSPFQMVFLTKEAYDAFVKANKDKTEAELKKMPEASRALAEMILGLADAFSFMSDDPNQLTFLLSGDKSKFIDIKFEDETGKEVERNGSSSSGDGLYSYYFSTKPSPKWKMMLMVETEKAIKKIPFNLTNIDLP
ncbi:MAG: hypothetical protein ACK4TA_10025 [Saprospiraceae bacterium]